MAALAAWQSEDLEQSQFRTNKWAVICRHHGSCRALQVRPGRGRHHLHPCSCTPPLCSCFDVSNMPSFLVSRPAVMPMVQRGDLAQNKTARYDEQEENNFIEDTRFCMTTWRSGMPYLPTALVANIIIFHFHCKEPPCSSQGHAHM